MCHALLKKTTKTFLETLSTSETLKCSAAVDISWRVCSNSPSVSSCSHCTVIRTTDRGFASNRDEKPSSVYGLQIHTALPVCQCSHMKTNTHHSTMMTSVHGLKWSRFSYQTLHLSSKSFTLFYNNIYDTIFRRSRQKLAVKLR